MPGLSVEEGRDRYWLLVHDGIVHPVTWQDGERLLDLCVRVTSGRAAEQDFTFTPRGAGLHQQLTVRVRADIPLELVTAYGPHPADTSVMSSRRPADGL